MKIFELLIVLTTFAPQSPTSEKPTKISPYYQRKREESQSKSKDANPKEGDCGANVVSTKIRNANLHNLFDKSKLQLIFNQKNPTKHPYRKHLQSQSILIRIPIPKKEMSHQGFQFQRKRLWCESHPKYAKSKEVDEPFRNPNPKEGDCGANAVSTE